jgi:glycine dehydrogenase
MESFVRRHIGPRPDDLPEMLATIGAPSLDALIDDAIPAAIRRTTPVQLPDGESEHEYLTRLAGVAKGNRVLRSFIGLGYYDTITPSVIRRCVFENPSWYTPYTPYQAEIAQGRLESLLNFQTVVTDLTGMPVAGASLLDEATAAGEAMTLLHRVSPKKPADGGVFLVSDRIFPQTLAVLQSRAEPLGITLQVAAPESWPVDAPDVFGALLQYPDDHGAIVDIAPIIARAHAARVLVAVATDLLALTLLTPPGELGADVVVGNSQRFGVPLGFGGPHAAFFATRQEFVRHAPGRLIGVSIDVHGHRAYRMALQTRGEKATSNICTAQALLANMAAMYAVYHGPEGLTAIARHVHDLTRALAARLAALGVRQENAHYFDTLRLTLTTAQAAAVHRATVAAGYNLRAVSDTTVGISLDETATAADVEAIVAAVGAALGASGRPRMATRCHRRCAGRRRSSPIPSSIVIAPRAR